MGKERFSELRRSMEGISQRMLTLTLKELQQDGLIARTAYLAIPPRVEHELTKRGHSLLKPITKLGDWARQNRKRIQSARDKYDAQKPQKCARPSLILAQLLPSEADNRQPGSYQLARWVSTEKRASSDQPIAGGNFCYLSACPDLDYIPVGPTICREPWSSFPRSPFLESFRFGDPPPE